MLIISQNIKISDEEIDKLKKRGIDVIANTPEDEIDEAIEKLMNYRASQRPIEDEE